MIERIILRQRFNVLGRFLYNCGIVREELEL
jgi:hypothetical protein